MFTLSINDQAEPVLRGLVRQIAAGLADKGTINKAVGRAASQLTRKHLYGLANSRHRGGVALNFYEDAADSVSDHDLGGGVEIRIDKAGMAQRFYGGTIKAVNYSHLWIPIKGSEAEGKSAGEFDDLVPIINRTTNKGVALKDGEPLFALVEEIDQAPDPTVLPTAEEYAAVAADAINLVVDKLLEKNVETRPFAKGDA
jgi:hypothetical protein